MSMRTIPNTRWWRWSPPSVVTLPGHHGTFGLRISRALVRMNRNAIRNAANTSRTLVRTAPEPPSRLRSMLIASIHADLPMTPAKCALTGLRGLWTPDPVDAVEGGRAESSAQRRGVEHDDPRSLSRAVALAQVDLVR